MSINKTLSALSDEICRKILMKLKEEKINTGNLAVSLGITPQALSYHLEKLKKADLIYETKNKNFIYYGINLSVLDEVILWVNNLKDEEK